MRLRRDLPLSVRPGMDGSRPRGRWAGAFTGLLIGLLLAEPVRADDKAPDAKPQADLSGYSILNPTPDDKLRDLCTDRPTKATGACTVEPGRWQLEADLFQGTFQREHRVTSDTWLVANPTLKLGLTDRVDVEASIPIADIVRTHDRSARSDTTAEGIGDLQFRMKYALYGNGGSPLSIIIAPYIKVPTARSAIGNGAVEGGVLVPVGATLPFDLTLNAVSEVDVLKDSAGSGRHVSTQNLASLSHPLAGGVSASVELWSQVAFDPAGTTEQASFDLALAWSPKGDANLQWDCGLNLGLTHDTPGAQVYAGVSKRF